jgi:hypothetical protein
MRGFLIFLACAIPVVLASPFFWSIVRMETSAERVGYTNAAGVTQWAWLGPEAPWPDWALRPAGARMRVQSHFEAAPGMAALGLAQVDIEAAPQRALDAYAQAARAAGWEVAFFHFDGATPEIPPRPFRMCIAEARQGSRMLRLSLEEDGRWSRGSLHWSEGDPPIPNLIGAAPGGC